MTRKQHALAIRDAILPWFLRNATWENQDCGNNQMGTKRATNGRFNMSLRTPFTPMPENASDNHMEAALQQRTTSLPYALDIWMEHRKVFDLSWNDATGVAQVMSFHSGAWERDVMALDRHCTH